MTNAELARAVLRYKRDHYCSWAEAVERASPTLLKRWPVLQAAVAQVRVAELAVEAIVKNMDDGEDYS